MTNFQYLNQLMYEKELLAAHIKLAYQFNICRSETEINNDLLRYDSLTEQCEELMRLILGGEIDPLQNFPKLI